MFIWSKVGISSALLVLTIGYVFLLLVAIIDLKYRLILNVMTYPAIVIALGLQLLVLHQNPTMVLLGGVFAFLIFFLTAWLKPGEVGGGDVKLALLIGVTFGFPSVLLALLIGAAVSAVVIVYMLITRRGGLKTGIPYAPFLCVGAMALLLVHPMMFG
jgi:prepilin signal peptidase PulO-like enzyme (type II secretory pathway)